MRNRRTLRLAALSAFLLVGGASLAVGAPPAPPAAGTTWTPADDWRDSNELETFSSVCKEIPLSECSGQGDSCDMVVIDVETMGLTPTFVSLGEGAMLKLSRIASGEVSVKVLPRDEAELSCKPTDALAMDWGVPLRPCAAWDFEDVKGEFGSICPAIWLPVGEACPDALREAADAFYEADLGRFQARYAQLMMEGHSNEARALAVSFLGDEACVTGNLTIPTPSPGLVLHEVSYNGKPARARTMYPSQTNAVWEEVSQRTISFTFRGATIDRVAEFLRSATGLAVSVDVPSDVAKTKRFYVTCRDQTVKDALEAICRAGGLPFSIVDNQIVLSLD